MKEEGGPHHSDDATKRQGPATFVLRSFVGVTDLICEEVTGQEKSASAAKVTQVGHPRFIY